MSQTEVQLIKNGAVVDADINGMSSSKLSGALPAISGASLTNLPTPVGKVRNLIINGAMQVAQRGTSSTANDSFSVDRFENQYSGVDAGPTFAQVDVASGTSPYTNGFRKALKITNADQSSGAGSSDMMAIVYKFEAQDIANSGWNYLSNSSYITLSYWVKSSIAQNFYGRFQSNDGTSQNYPFETGSLSADTWTKITKTIPGNSNLQFDNDVNHGLTLELSTFRGTDKTGSIALDAWNAYGGGTTRTPDQTSTWYTTNGATFEITGVQLEVGSVATDFEHRSFQVEKSLCMRYFQRYVNLIVHGYVPDNGSRSYSHGFVFPVPMRTTPSTTLSNTGSVEGQYISDGQSVVNVSALNATGHTAEIAELYFNLSSDLTDFRGAYLISASSTSRQTTYSFNAEL